MCWGSICYWSVGRLYFSLWATARRWERYHAIELSLISIFNSSMFTYPNRRNIGRCLEKFRHKILFFIGDQIVQNDRKLIWTLWHGWCTRVVPREHQKALFTLTAISRLWFITDREYYVTHKLMLIWMYHYPTVGSGYSGLSP